MGNNQPAKRARAVWALLTLLMAATACSTGGNGAIDSTPAKNGVTSVSASGTADTTGPIVQDFDCSDPVWSGNDLAEVAASGWGVPDLMAITLGQDTLAWTDGSVSLGDLNFQKVGLALKTGAAMDIPVPTALRGKMKIG